jgi:hypothetical protein
MGIDQECSVLTTDVDKQRIPSVHQKALSA